MVFYDRTNDVGRQSASDRFLHPAFARELGILPLEPAPVREQSALGRVRAGRNFGAIDPAAPITQRLRVFASYLDTLWSPARQVVHVVGIPQFLPSSGANSSRQQFWDRGFCIETTSDFGNPPILENLSVPLSEEGVYPENGTIAGWIKVVALGSSPLPMILIGDVPSEEYILLGADQEGRAVIWNYSRELAVDNQITTVEKPFEDTPLWTHLAFVASNGSWKIYLNGRETATVVAAGSNVGDWLSVFSGTPIVSLFGPSYTPGDTWSVRFAEVGIWNRALSDTELMALVKEPDVLYLPRYRPVIVDPFRLVLDSITGDGELGPILLRKNQLVIPGSITGDGALGQPVLLRAQLVVPASIVGDGALGPVLVLKTQLVIPASITGDGSPGQPTLIRSQVISLDSIVGDGAIGLLALQGQIRLDSIVGAVALGPISVARIEGIVLPSIDGDGTLGPILVIKTQLIQPASITGDGALGQPTVRKNQLVVPASIVGDGALGQPSVLRSQFLVLGSIVGDGSLGQPVLATAQVLVLGSIVGDGSLGPILLAFVGLNRVVALTARVALGGVSATSMTGYNIQESGKIGGLNEQSASALGAQESTATGGLDIQASI